VRTLGGTQLDEVSYKLSMSAPAAHRETRGLSPATPRQKQAPSNWLFRHGLLCRPSAQSRTGRAFAGTSPLGRREIEPRRTRRVAALRYRAGILPRLPPVRQAAAAATLPTEIRDSGSPPRPDPRFLHLESLSIQPFMAPSLGIWFDVSHAAKHMI